MTAFIPDGVSLILAIPAATAAILALTPGYWLSARLNVLSSLLTFLHIRIRMLTELQRIASC